MSEIFYTQIDKNLASELDARALAGRIRDSKSLDYMVGKVANVRVTAYEGNGTSEKELFILGGETVRGSSYQPSGQDGFLTDGATRTYKELSWIASGKGDKATFEPVNKYPVRQNSNNRIPPYISSANISVGDHSMGLLNTATFVIEVANPERDLDFIEEIFFRAGRYIKMEIEYPPSAVITGLSLDPNTIPSDEKLKILYPGSVLDTKKKEISKLNNIAFEGLITSFTFDYQQDYTVQATVSMRGTSNVYTDVSMFINSTTTNKNGTNATSIPNPIATPDAYTATIEQKAAEQDKPDDKSFYAKLYDDVDSKYKKVIEASENKSNTTQLNGQDDRWYLIGNAWKQTEKTDGTDQKTFSRYITLGYLINFINDIVLAKVNDAVPTTPRIICSSEICYSNYYEHICSADPKNILLLPKSTERGTTEKYGDITYFEDIDMPEKWYGFRGKEVCYPARIFINLDTIKEIYESWTASTTSFKVSDFLSSITNKIQTATGNAIQLSLITHPKQNSMLLLYDSNFLGTPSEVDDVKPYHIPMSAAYPAGVPNGSIGSIVHDFKLSAKIPDSVATLSYVLNQNPDEISEDQIAPYLNYMYNSGDPEKVKKADEIYEKANAQHLEDLKKTRSEFGKNINDQPNQKLFQEALVKYIQMPMPTIKQSQQMMAPIFPFEAEFTIDGIHGFRYGDVVTFDILPYRYRANTVFSIIGIEHDATQDGQWTTRVRCIMRPRIGK